MKYKLKGRFPLLLLLIITTSMVLAGCGPATITGDPNTSSLDEQIPESVYDLVISYLRDEHISGGTVYLATDEPDAPQEGDVRIDSIVYAGETSLYETIGVAYEIAYSGYYFLRKDANDEGAYSWNAGQPYYLVLQRSGYDDSWYGVLGFDYVRQGKKVKDVIQEVAYNLMDIEVSLNLDGYPQLVGPGSTSDYFNEEFKRDILEGSDTYYEGDYWLRLSYKDFTVICYYYEQEDVVKTNSIETTRTDVATHRGLRIGMTRAEVLSAYPIIYDSQYWGYEGDYLWYCNNDEGWGAALIFWFEDDIVAQIELTNMFN